MTYALPKKLPPSLTLGDKTFSLVLPKDSVKRGVCVGNDGGWFYYFPRAVVDDASNINIGHRRHFSVRQASGSRAVHISMKPSKNKKDDIMIWYRFDSQWTGKRTEPEGWGRKEPFPGQNAARVQKAVSLLTQFLEAMTAVAEGKSAAPTKPCLTPPLFASSGGSDAWDDDLVGFPPPVPVANTSPVSTPLVQKVLADTWEDWEDT